MGRINTNIPALIAQGHLNRTFRDLSVHLERLSTGLRINRGADDPAGLIVAERLRSEILGISNAVTNSERASSVIATTEGYLAEVADLLNSMRGLIVETANRTGLSQEEIEANQLQVDSAIDAITRISNVATFAGLQLLNGSLEYQTSGIVASAIVAANIFSAQYGNNSHIPIQVDVVTSAQTGSLFLSGNTTGAPGVLLSSVTLEIAGNLSVQTISFVSGTSLADGVKAINGLSDATGVSAALVDSTDLTSGMTFNSVGYGSSQFVSVRNTGPGGSFFDVQLAQGGATVTRDEGQNVGAVINGTLAVGNGLDIRLNTPALSLELTLTPAYAQTIAQRRSFEITGGGAIFQLGPKINFDQQIGIAVQSVSESRLGGSTIEGVRYYLDSIRSGKTHSLIGGSAQEAALIVDNAINDIAVLRGRLGAFERNIIETNIRSLQIGLENITAAESQVRDADFAVETAALTRAQILAQAGVAVLATANATSQSVLTLLQ
jgi:flagellin